MLSRICSPSRSSESPVAHLLPTSPLASQYLIKSRHWIHRFCAVCFFLFFFHFPPFFTPIFHICAFPFLIYTRYVAALVFLPFCSLSFLSVHFPYLRFFPRCMFWCTLFCFVLFLFVFFSSSYVRRISTRYFVFTWKKNMFSFLSFLFVLDT